MIAFIESKKNRKVLQKMSTIDQQTREGIRRAWFDLGKMIKKEANTEILKKRHQDATHVRRRIRTDTGYRWHVASAPYETHANMRGTLRKSLGWKAIGFAHFRVGYGVSARKVAPKYAGWVEFGTKRMKARPSIKNAIDATQQRGRLQFVTRIGQELE